MPTELRKSQAKFFALAFFALILALICAPSANASCSLTSSSVPFGSYDVFSPTPLDTVGQVIFRCSQNDKNVSISLSRGGSADFSPRRMTNGASILNYNLYRDAARTVIWGDGSGGTQTYFINNPQPNNTDIPVSVYGRILAGQSTAATGNYSDTISAVVNY